MRPAARIKPILSIIEEAWNKNPDLRLMQLLENAWACFYTDDLTWLVECIGYCYGTTPLLWGTYVGKSKQPLRYVPLEQLETSHIRKILETQVFEKERVKIILTQELERRLQ